MVFKLGVCLAGPIVCAPAHDWAREIVTLGHEVKLIPAQRIKASLPQAHRITPLHFPDPQRH
jgi:hypothetical protein